MCPGPGLEPAGRSCRQRGQVRRSFWPQLRCFPPATSREALGAMARKLVVSLEAFSPCSAAVNGLCRLHRHSLILSTHIMTNGDRMGLSPTSQAMLSLPSECLSPSKVVFLCFTVGCSVLICQPVVLTLYLCWCSEALKIRLSAPLTCRCRCLTGFVGHCALVSLAVFVARIVVQRASKYI